MELFEYVEQNGFITNGAMSDQAGRQMVHIDPGRDEQDALLEAAADEGISGDPGGAPGRFLQTELSAQAR
jgi:hypothetical protein